MDFASLFEIVGAYVHGLVEFFRPFTLNFNGLGLAIVAGGTLLALLVRFSPGTVLRSLLIGIGDLLRRPVLGIGALGGQLAGVADTMRRHGPSALVGVKTRDPFFRLGLKMIADGCTIEALRADLERARSVSHERLLKGRKVIRATGDAAFGFGMIGAMVSYGAAVTGEQMLLTTGATTTDILQPLLCGLLMLTLFSRPLEGRLADRAEDETRNHTLVIEALALIRQSGASKPEHQSPVRVSALRALAQTVEAA